MVNAPPYVARGHTASGEHKASMTRLVSPLIAPPSQAAWREPSIGKPPASVTAIDRPS